MFCQTSSVPQGSHRSCAAPRSPTVQEPFSLDKSCLEFAPAATVVLKESLVPWDWGGPGCGIWGRRGESGQADFLHVRIVRIHWARSVCPLPAQLKWWLEPGLKVELNLKLGFIGCRSTSVIPVVPPELLCLLSPLCMRGLIHVKQSRKMGDFRLVPVLFIQQEG